jgi:putative FmdB family regulatory protein
MPLREFKCRACSHEFEALVRAGDPPLTCRACGAADLEQLLSLSAIKTEQTTQLALKAGRKRAKQAKRDEVEYQKEIERSHDH